MKLFLALVSAALMVIGTISSNDTIVLASIVVACTLYTVDTVEKK